MHIHYLCYLYPNYVTNLLLLIRFEKFESIMLQLTSFCTYTMMANEVYYKINNTYKHLSFALKNAVIQLNL